MRKVICETAYPLTAPSPRVRVVAFSPQLSRLGVSLEYRPTLTDAEYTSISSTRSSFEKARVLTAAASRLVLKARPRSPDLYMVHRLIFPASLPGIDPPRRVDVYDFDDALFVGSVGQGNRRWAWMKDEARRWRAYATRARLVVAGNSYLADHARLLNRHVEVIPSCVAPDSQPLRSHEPRDVVTLGWIGSASTAQYLDDVLPAIASLNSGRQRVHLVLVGYPRQIEEDWIETKPWSIETEKEHLASFDIGLMPLPDDEWTRGKCGYKLLQYFSAGVPAVASPVGINRELIAGRGVAASGPGDWKRALEELVSDVDARRELGERGRAFVEVSYSYERWAPEVARLFSEL